MSASNPAKTSPLVSVVIPCFNKGSVVLTAVESVLRNSYEPVETIVVNDGSTDLETIRALDELRSKGTLVVDQANSGVAASRMQGLRHASGEYVLFLDHDDAIASNTIELLLRTLVQHPECAFAYGDVIYFGEKAGLQRGLPFSGSRLIRGNFVSCSSLFRASDIDGYAFDPALRALEDWDFYLQLWSQGRAGVYVPGAYLFYRIVRSQSRNLGSYNMLSLVRQMAEIRTRRGFALGFFEGSFQYGLVLHPILERLRSRRLCEEMRRCVAGDNRLKEDMDHLGVTLL